MTNCTLAKCAALVVSLSIGAAPAFCDEPIPISAVFDSAARLALAPPEPIPPLGQDIPAGGDSLALMEVEQLAIAYYPALREAAGQLRAAQGNWVQVGLKPNPELGYSGNEIGNEGAGGQQGGFVSQEFVTANKLGWNRAVADREVAAAMQRVERARLQVLTTARVYFFEVLAAERALALAKQLRDIADQSVQVSELRLKALDIPRSSLIQSQIESESAALLEQQATQRREAAWRRLSTVIGSDLAQPQRIEDAFLNPLPEFDWESSRERVLANSPETAELRFAVERAQAAVQRASAGRVPNVSMMAGVAHDYATDDTVANVQVSMPLPVFNRNQGAIAQACGELTAARAALQQRELALEQRLAATLRDYATARQRVARYQQTILPAARESLDLINNGYRQGELEFIQVLATQQTYAQTHATYIQDLETAWKTWAQMEGLLVGPLPDGSN